MLHISFSSVPRTNGNTKYILEALRFPKQRQKDSKHSRSLFRASNNANIYINQHLECQTAWPFAFMLFTARPSGWERDWEPDGALASCHWKVNKISLGTFRSGGAKLRKELSRAKFPYNSLLISCVHRARTCPIYNFIYLPLVADGPESYLVLGLFSKQFLDRF